MRRFHNNLRAADGEDVNKKKRYYRREGTITFQVRGWTGAGQNSKCERGCKCLVIVRICASYDIKTMFSCILKHGSNSFSQDKRKSCDALERTLLLSFYYVVVGYGRIILTLR